VVESNIDCDGVKSFACMKKDLTTSMIDDMFLVPHDAAEMDNIAAF
jgi:hypothetical protein